MFVVQPSTPANHFHMLRRQAYSRPRKPLIAITPKQLLRRKGAVSQVADFTTGTFQPVIGEHRTDLHVTRVVLCTGRLYYDLLNRREKDNDTSVAIVRIEQLYPNPVKELTDELAKYPGADLIWAQDEPANQGAWPHLA